MLDSLDLERVESANIDADTANIIMQLQEWFNAKTDQLNMVLDIPDNTVIVLNDFKIEDDHDKKMFKAGVVASLSIIGKFPVTMTINEHTEDD